ncbi:hypothetical protein NADE_001574 [Nannochloris sp. 'desiccata']|nr:hypothetical protein NADE_001574 [Chlorella desiccata (nom. nud.)]
MATSLCLYPTMHDSNANAMDISGKIPQYQIYRRNSLFNRTPLASQFRDRRISTAAISDLLTLAVTFSPPPACFDTQCQAQKDAIFAASLITPVLAFAAVAALISRRSRSENSFEDSDTGAIFEAPEGTEPIRDRYGELAFRAVSYTPWPVKSGDSDAGEAIRIEVGAVGATQFRTYFFDKLLPQSSQLVVVKLPRPLGIVFEEDTRMGRAVIAEIVAGGNADQLSKKASLDLRLAATAPQKGDILRACTATNIVYRTGALILGAQTPERAIVVYGADNEKWPAVATALTRGLVADGEVTLVLERKIVET